MYTWGVSSAGHSPDQSRSYGASIRCLQDDPNAPTALPGNITLTAGQVVSIASVYDDDYLPYSSITGLAQTGTLNADGTKDTLIDIQGVLTTTGLTVAIPYKVENASVTLPAFSSTKTVISDHIQGGNAASTDGGGTAVDVEFSYPEVTLNVGVGTILATIKAVGSDLNAVKLDINKGIGTDVGILLAEFTIATNSSGGSGTIQLKDVPGIPDRRFGEETIQQTTQANPTGTAGFYHNNLYLPVLAEDGKIWLNHQLGAPYTNMFLTDGSTPNPDFNPAAIPTSLQDIKAYGNRFQHGRYSDGHEIVRFNAIPVGPGFTSAFHTFLNDTKTSREASTDKTLTSNQFVANEVWYNGATTNDQLWDGVNAPNNPCPEGFRVPRHSDYQNLRSAINWGSITDMTERRNFVQHNLNIKFVFSGNLAINAQVHPLYYSLTGGYIFAGTSDEDNSSATTTAHVYLSPGAGYWPAIAEAKQGNRKGDALTIRCIQHVNEPVPVPANMTIQGNKAGYVASISDNDYLPYTAPTGPALQAPKIADGNTTETAVDVQGTLTTEGITVSLPYQSTGDPAYEAYTYNIMVEDSLTEDGNGGMISFSYPAGTATSPSGAITMTIKAINGTINLKKLDINNGLGNGTATEGHITERVFGVLVAEVPILINDANDTNYVQLRNTSGIPDRRFGQNSADGGANEHDFIYLPVMAEDGSIWLNNNLGADYSNIHHGSFNPAQQAQTHTDFLAYGSLFQWGRTSDGHELVNRTSNDDNTITMVNSPVFGTSTDNPGHAGFQLVQANPSDWSTGDLNLWKGPDAANNPCPEGFKVPLYSDFDPIRYHYSFVGFGELDNALKLSATGLNETHINSNAIVPKFRYAGEVGLLYAIGEANTSTSFRRIDIRANNANGQDDQTRRAGGPVRCVQHVEEPAPVPSGMTLTGNKVSYIASINDADYLPYSPPTGPAYLAGKNADTVNEATSIDIQGILTTTGKTISIPYTSTGSPSYEAYSYTVVVPDSLTEDGVGRSVNFSYPSGSATSPKGMIEMTIKSIGGDLNLKKLDINNGVGNGTSVDGNIASGVFGVLVAEVPIYVDASNTIQYIQLRNISGIPDRRFGENTTNSLIGTAPASYTDGGNNYYHDNLYYPVTDGLGQVWLSTNLGSNYGNVRSSAFSPTMQATASNDFDAVGYLFQWGRKPDGHEIVLWNSATNLWDAFGERALGTGTNNISFPLQDTSNTDGVFRVNRTVGTAVQFTIPGTGTTVSQYYSWINASAFGNTPTTLWGTESHPNNPCPEGFRLPKALEVQNSLNNEGITNESELATQSSLKMTNYYGTTNNSTQSIEPTSFGGMVIVTGEAEGFIPSGTNEWFAATVVGFNGGNVVVGRIPYSYGKPIRCIQD